jgi:hypothetical protein
MPARLVDEAHVSHADNDERAETPDLVQALRSEVDDLRRRLDQAEAEKAELRRLVSQAQQLAARLLPAQSPAGPGEPPGLDRWKALRDSKKNLGASLCVTGVAAGMAGVALHFLLRAHVVMTDVHLGYIIGLIGLLAFLAGLVLVY